MLARALGLKLVRQASVSQNSGCHILSMIYCQCTQQCDVCCSLHSADFVACRSLMLR